MSEKISPELFNEFMKRQKLTAKSLAGYMLCSERTVYRWIEKGIDANHFQNVKIIVNYNKRNR